MCSLQLRTKMSHCLRSAFFGNKMEHIDQLHLQITSVHGPTGFVFLVDEAYVVDGDNETGQTVRCESDANELFKVFNARCASDFVVMAVEDEAHGKVPARPETTDDCSDDSGQCCRQEG